MCVCQILFYFPSNFDGWSFTLAVMILIMCCLIFVALHAINKFNMCESTIFFAHPLQSRSYLLLYIGILFKLYLVIRVCFPHFEAQMNQKQHSHMLPINYFRGDAKYDQKINTATKRSVENYGRRWPHTRFDIL